MRYVIFEDELFAMQRLQLIVERLHPSYELAYKGTTVAEAIEFFQSGQDIDLVFMDIELADGNCFGIFDEVNVNTPIIFTTAYDEYALRAFKVHSIDYLLKPIAESDLSLAIAKFERLRSEQRPSPDYSALVPKPETQRILTVSGDNFLYAELSEVAFFMSEDNYVLAYLTSGKRRMTNFSNLQDVVSILPTTDFFQLSRNIVASINSIKSVSKFFRGRLIVRLQAGEEEQECTVSSNRREQFLDWLGK